MTEKIKDTRNKITIDIGTPKKIELENYSDRIAREISKEVGGCKRLKGKGYWSDTGNSEDTERTYEDIQREHSNQISFVTERSQTYIMNKVEDIFKKVSSPESINWINVEIDTVRVNHIKV